MPNGRFFAAKFVNLGRTGTKLPAVLIAANFCRQRWTLPLSVWLTKFQLLTSVLFIKCLYGPYQLGILGCYQPIGRQSL
jgi:hypothetical protein